MVASHTLLDGERNRLHFEAEAAKEVFSFGRWILLSSALTFLAGEGSRLLVAALLDVRTLAFFTLAGAMNAFALQAIYQLAGRVMFAAYAETERIHPERFYVTVRKSRLFLLIPAWGLAALFVILGGPLMEVLYDPRYAESGPMLEILAMGSLAGCVSASYAGVLLAKGKVRASAILTAIQVAILFSSILASANWYGYKGVVIGVAVANWLVYPMYAWIFARLSLWQPEVDLPVLGGSILIVCLALLGFPNPYY